MSLYPTRPRHDYAGPRRWAEDHARRLQHRVGTVAAGTVVIAVTAQRYGESWASWGVMEEWQYLGRSSLGTYGQFLMLPL